MNYPFIRGLALREQKRAEKYLERMSKKPPGPRGKGKTKAWRLLRSKIRSHAIHCKVVAEMCSLRCI